MSIKNKELKIMNEEWRDVMSPKNCYFCHFLSFECASMQVYKKEYEV
jgi:hypothetical protein